MRTLLSIYVLGCFVFGLYHSFNVGRSAALHGADPHADIADMCEDNHWFRFVASWPFIVAVKVGYWLAGNDK